MRNRVGRRVAAVAGAVISTAAVSGANGRGDAGNAIAFEPATYFAAILVQGPAWNPALGRDDQPGIREHRRYMASLLERGTAVAGGPFADEPGGLAILRAESMAAAKKLIDADPCVRSGIMAATVRRWVALPMGGGG